MSTQYVTPLAGCLCPRALGLAGRDYQICIRGCWLPLHFPTTSLFFSQVLLPINIPNLILAHFLEDLNDTCELTMFSLMVAQMGPIVNE